MPKNSRDHKEGGRRGERQRERKRRNEKGESKGRKEGGNSVEMWRRGEIEENRTG